MHAYTRIEIHTFRERGRKKSKIKLCKFPPFSLLTLTPSRSHPAPPLLLLSFPHSRIKRIKKIHIQERKRQASMNMWKALEWKYENFLRGNFILFYSSSSSFYLNHDVVIQCLINIYSSYNFISSSISSSLRVIRGRESGGVFFNPLIHPLPHIFSLSFKQHFKWMWKERWNFSFVLTLSIFLLKGDRFLHIYTLVLHFMYIHSSFHSFCTCITLIYNFLYSEENIFMIE